MFFGRLNLKPDNNAAVAFLIFGNGFAVGIDVGVFGNNMSHADGFEAFFVQPFFNQSVDDSSARADDSSQSDG